MARLPSTPPKTGYTCAWRQFLKDHCVIPNMSAVGYCGDYAPAGGFFGMLKPERVNRRRYLRSPMCSTASNASTVRGSSADSMPWIGSSMPCRDGGSKGCGQTGLAQTCSIPSDGVMP